MVRWELGPLSLASALHGVAVTPVKCRVFVSRRPGRIELDRVSESTFWTVRCGALVAPRALRMLGHLWAGEVVFPPASARPMIWAATTGRVGERRHVLGGAAGPACLGALHPFVAHRSYGREEGLDWPASCAQVVKLPQGHRRRDGDGI